MSEWILHCLLPFRRCKQSTVGRLAVGNVFMYSTPSSSARAAASLPTSKVDIKHFFLRSRGLTQPRCFLEVVRVCVCTQLMLYVDF